jgi:D-alanyl-lipoteichoic acid acyltransferase DltB (MBOAT superfamily)
VLGLVGWRPDAVTLQIVLPMGISFYTFMTISYVIDAYRDEITPEDSLIDFALFVAYFPHLVAGPILRASKLLPQITHPRVLTREQNIDNLSAIVSSAYRPGAAASGAEVLVATYAFAFQIYGDFAGYSNMARGISKLLGIELNINFRFPYFVASPQEFWRHWHISLSTWLRDYLYIPLGGSRRSEGATKRNLMITMILGGLWHGAAWTFVLWGVYQGLALVIARSLIRWSESRDIDVPSGLNWRRAALVVIMFHVTCYGWLIFRATSAAHVGELTRQIVTDLVPSISTLPALLAPVVSIVAPLMIVHAYQARHESESAPLGLVPVMRYALYAGVFYLVLLFGSYEGAQFIYFQF